MPQINPNDDSAVLVRWHTASGSWVVAGQALATLETTKAAFDVDAPREGYVFFDHRPKTVVAVGTAIAWISDKNEPPRHAASADMELAGIGTAEARFSRKALRLMKEHGLNPGDFASTGRIERGRRRTAGARTLRLRSAGARDDADPLEQPASKLLEVRLLDQVYRQAIPSTVCVSLSCQRIALRLKELADQIGPMTLLELAIHEVARLLSDFPDLNGFYSEGRAWSYRSVVIGFALNLGRSLRVPVLRDAAGSSQVDIVRRVRDLTLRYMRDELKVEDLAGGTFTITDLSSFEVSHFVPVLNYRQSAILGICAERPGTCFRDLTLTFDHRLSDGMRAAKFLGELRARLENIPPA